MAKLLKLLARQIPPIARLHDSRNELLLELTKLRGGVAPHISLMDDSCNTIQVQEDLVTLPPQASGYDREASRLFGRYSPAPNTWPATSFTPETKWGELISSKMRDVEIGFARELLQEIHEDNIPGSIVEFGVFDGTWLEQLIEIAESLGMHREVLGFDSFQGLPDLSPWDEGMGWSKGLYAASYEAVAERLNTESRPDVHLIRGWFCDTIRGPRAQAVGEVAFARIDGDLYQSAVESLSWLTERLTDQSILVFDDWTFNLDKGETKAFFEWAPRVPYRFEPLGFFATGHFYLRIHRR